MPNWCVNQIHISGPDALDVERLMTEPQTLLHYDATKAAIKMFLAGIGGLLKPTIPMTFEAYPELISGIGDSNAQNNAFDAFLMLLNQETVLTPEICQTILILFEQTGLKQCCWNDLPIEVRDTLSPLINESAHDWSGSGFQRLSPEVVWEQLNLPEPIMKKSFSLSSLCPPSLLTQINGFNGRLISHIPSGHHDNCERLGTKWEMVDVEVQESREGFVKLEFDTAWSPALPPIEALAIRFPNSVFTHFYAESGCAYCGYVVYEEGEVQEESGDDMVFSDEENEDGYHDLIGPAYITENFDRYGG